MNKKSAIRKYCKMLPDFMTKYYGKRPYRPAHVDEAIQRINLNTAYIVYAYVLFCDHKELIKLNLLRRSELNSLSKDIIIATNPGPIVGLINGAFGTKYGQSGIAAYPVEDILSVDASSE